LSKSELNARTSISPGDNLLPRNVKVVIRVWNFARSDLATFTEASKGPSSLRAETSMK